MTTQTLNVRIDKNTKLQAQKVVEKLGLDLSSAIKLFINKLVMTESIPFEINTKGRMNNPKFIKQLKKDMEWTTKYGKRYSSAKEMFDDILS